MLLKAVTATLNAYSDASGVQDIFGRTPLHSACMGRLTEPRTKAALVLLERSPQIALVADKVRHTALHLAARADHENPCFRTLVRAFLVADEHCMSRIDGSGKTVADLMGKVPQSSKESLALEAHPGRNGLASATG